MLAQENHHKHLLRNSYITRRPKHFQPSFLPLMLCWFEHLPAWVSATGGRQVRALLLPQAGWSQLKTAAFPPPTLVTFSKGCSHCACCMTSLTIIFAILQAISSWAWKTQPQTHIASGSLKKNTVLSAQPWSQGNFHNSIICTNISSLDGNAPGFQAEVKFNYCT